MNLRMSALSSGDGDLTGRMEVKGNDELSTLADLFNSVFKKLEDTVKEIKREARANGNHAVSIGILTSDQR
jgi:methyl-accepting chemotaxis protein